MDYRMLETGEIGLELFRGFIRTQKVTRCWRRIGGAWVIRDAPFVDDWDEGDYRELCKALTDTLARGGFAAAAFDGGALKGFAAVDAAPLGSEGQYLELRFIYVSGDCRGRGVGARLFAQAAGFARSRSARKLYISAHSAVESQAFYRAMGCAEAEEYDEAHVRAEPCDCQLECAL